MSKGSAKEIIIGITLIIIIAVIAYFLYASTQKPLTCTVGAQCILQGVLGNYDAKCQCIPKPECQIDKYFACPDGSQTLWCLCQNGKYNCVSKPESQCPSGYCDASKPETWGTCLNNFGCGVGCNLFPTFAQQHGCVCTNPVQYAKEGESCLFKPCESGLNCEWDLSLNIKTCKNPNTTPVYANIGESCAPIIGKPCMAGLYCNALAIPPLICQLPANEGESCLSKPCAEGLICRFEPLAILQGFKVCRT